MSDPSRPTPAPLTPYLTVRDARAAIEFYQRAFDAEVLAQQATSDGTKLMHAALRLPNGGMLMLSDDFPEMNEGRRSTPEAYGGTPVTLHLDLPDVKVTWERAVSAGAEVKYPLALQFWGDEFGVLQDPFGHRWSLATRRREPSPAELAEGAAKVPGTKKD